MISLGLKSERRNTHSIVRLSDISPLKSGGFLLAWPLIPEADGLATPSSVRALILAQQEENEQLLQ